MTESKVDSDRFQLTVKSSDHNFVKSPGTITPEDLKPWSRESPSIAPIAWASVLNQVPTLKTYKRKVSHLQAQQSSPKHGRTKGSPSSVPDAIVPADVHTKCLTPVSPPVEPGIPEDLIHYTSASPSSIPAEWSSVVNLSPNASPSTLLKPPMETSLPRRIIAQRERRAREKLAKANIQPIRWSQIVPGTPEDFMRLSSASMATPRHPSSLMNSRVVPGTPEEVMPLSSASPATTAIVLSSVINVLEFNKCQQLMTLSVSDSLTELEIMMVDDCGHLRKKKIDTINLTKLTFYDSLVEFLFR